MKGKGRDGGKVQELLLGWERLRERGDVHYDDALLRTRSLDPRDGRQAFFLVYNSGRRRYIEAVAKRKETATCPFCSAFEGLELGAHGSLRVLPNTFPCLPYQFVLSPAEHVTTLEAMYLEDAVSFSGETGMEVYCNGRGAGGAYAHLVFQASARHPRAPRQDFLAKLQAVPFAEGGGVTAARFGSPVFGVKLTAPSAEQTAALVSRIAKESAWPVNLLFSHHDTLLIPRNEVEIPDGFGAWRFGVLEAVGKFICQDEETFERATYDVLHKARQEISHEDAAGQDGFIELVARAVSGLGADRGSAPSAPSAPKEVLS